MRASGEGGGGAGANVAVIALVSALAGAKIQDIVKALLTSGGGTMLRGKKQQNKGAQGAKERIDDGVECDDGASRGHEEPVLATSTAAPAELVTMSTSRPSSESSKQQQQQQQRPMPTPSSPRRPPLKTITRKSLGSPPPRGGGGGGNGQGQGGECAEPLVLCSACHENAVAPGSIPGAVSQKPRYSINKKPDPYLKTGRSKYLCWDDYFMSVAFLSAQRSKDPNKQVGAVIVGPDRIILGVGYNGFPRGCADHDLPWAKKSANNNPMETKYAYVCHAEMNAIMNKNSQSLDGATLYVTMYPCNECAKLIIQSGIKEVVYFEGKLTGLDGAVGGAGDEDGVKSGGAVGTAASASSSSDKKSVGGGGGGSTGYTMGKQSGGGGGDTRGADSGTGTGTGTEIDGGATSYSSPTKGGMQADPTYAAAGKLLQLAKVVVRQHAPSATIDVTYD